MNNIISYRFLVADDCVKYGNALCEYYFESVTASAYEEGYTKGEAKQKIEELKRYLSAGQAVVCGAFDGEQLIGFIWAYRYPYREDSNRLYVSVVHIDSSYRGKGIGKKMLREVEDEACRMGVKALWLHAEAENDGARRFYEREGYVQERIQYVKKTICNLSDGEIFGVSMK